VTVLKRAACVALTTPALCAGCTQNHAAATTSDRHTAPGCRAAAVHYGRFRGPGPNVKTLPWVVAEPRSVGLVGHLFYYDAHNPWARRGLTRWRIYTGGRSPDNRINMKILWSAPSPISDTESLVVRGTRMTQPAHFSRVLDVGPSILDVPRAGCWRLDLRTGPVVTHLTVLAVSR
jgi:hypothetical protein